MDGKRAKESVGGDALTSKTVVECIRMLQDRYDCRKLASTSLVVVADLQEWCWPRPGKPEIRLL